MAASSIQPRAGAVDVFVLACDLAALVDDSSHIAPANNG
jgi:hypothetical protein